MTAHDLLDAAVSAVHTPQGGALDAISIVAAAVAIVLVIAGSFVKTMIPLRWLAVGGSLGFLVYGALHPAPIMLALYGVLLPIHVWRAVEMVRLTRRVAAATQGDDLSGVWLRPYMNSRRAKAGELLFRRGDTADHLYLLADGRIEFVEIGETMEAGQLFGEIAFFAPDRRRSMTARCATDCTVLSIDGQTFRQLYFQNPAFGFEVVTLLTRHLTSDLQRVHSRAPHGA